MRILDRYLMRQILIPIVFCSFTLVFLILMADLFDHLNDLMTHDTPATLVFTYYLHLVPFSFVETIPWATLLGSMFLLVNFNAHNEFLAMKASGLGISKIILPLLYVGLVIGIATFLVSDRLVPPTFRRAQAILEAQIEHSAGSVKSQTVFHNFTYFSRNNQLYYAKKFDPASARLENVIILAYGDAHRLKRKIYARTASWDGFLWKLAEVTEYETDPTGKMVGEPRSFSEKVYEGMRETPQELANAASESTYLSYKELKDHIARLKENGLQAYSEMVELQHKLSHPWHSLIMMLVAVCLLSTTHRKKVIALNVLYCIALVVGFHLMGAFSIALGKTGTLPPFVSAWGSSLIFAVSSVFFLDRANY